MTVKSLSDMQKIEIGDLYLFRSYSIQQLATIYKRSSRTIIRALEERGCYTIKKRVRKPKPSPAPVPVVIPTKTSWWKRIFSNMKFTYTGRGEGPTA